jgi:hypothetical protein
LTKNDTQGSINQQIFPLIPERFLSELPEPPLSAAASSHCLSFFFVWVSSRFVDGITPGLSPETKQLLI